jgi:hypothetical protein
MRSLRVGLLVVLATGIVACSGGSDTEVRSESSSTSSSDPTSTGSSGTTTCTLPGASTDAKTSTGGDAIALLNDVRAGHQSCADRVVFDFRDGTPGYSFEYRPGPFTFGESGQPIAIDGSAFLLVRLSPAAGVDLDQPDAPPTYTGPESIKPQGLAHVREIRELSDFEGELVWVIGLDEMRPFTAATLTGPVRVYVDIG